MIRRRRYEISIPADKIVEGSRLLRARAHARGRPLLLAAVATRLASARLSRIFIIPSFHTFRIRFTFDSVRGARTCHRSFLASRTPRPVVTRSCNVRFAIARPNPPDCLVGDSSISTRSTFPFQSGAGGRGEGWRGGEGRRVPRDR